jgi:hypothetical protein
MLSPTEKDAFHVFGGLGLHHNLALLERAWQAELAGLASLVTVVALDKGALVVEAVSAPAMQEISLRRHELVRRINRHFANPCVQQITVRMARNGN